MSNAKPHLKEAAKSPPTEDSRDAVLLIEDNEILANLLTILMRGLRLRVYWAADGATARHLFGLHQDELKLVLADCRLPDMDGRDVCLKMRSVLPELPVLVMSGSVSGRGVAPLPRNRLVEFLPKPYAPSDVLARVRKLLNETNRDAA